SSDLQPANPFGRDDFGIAQGKTLVTGRETRIRCVQFVKRFLHADWLEDSVREKCAETYAADFLDNAPEQNVAGVAVRPFRTGLEIEFASRVLAQQFVLGNAFHHPA